MWKKKEIKEHVELLHKDNTSLYLMCILVGLFTGVTVSTYRYGLSLADKIRHHFLTPELLSSPTKLVFIWIIFIFIGIFVDFLSKKFPTTSGSGIPQVKALILRRLEYVSWFKELTVKFFGGLLGIGAGLSLGREGPSVQLGSYIGYGFTKLFKKSYVEEKYLVTSGASAGLAGAFGAPLAGVIFSLEELHRFISSKLIICTFFSTVFSDFISRRIFGIEPAFNLIAKYPNDINRFLQFFLFILFGIIIAIFGKMFTLSLINCQKIFKEIAIPRYIKISFVMTLSFLICIFFPDINGGGHHLVEILPTTEHTILALLLIFILKLVFTALSYSTGFQGGIFLPMLVLGALVGKIFGLILIEFFGFGSEYISHFMVLGMAGYFVAVVKAPITGTVLILEMTGNFDHLLAIATVSISAYYMTDILKLEPIYEILYNKLPKKTVSEDLENCSYAHEPKTLICIPVVGESEFDNKLVKEIVWPKESLIVAIRRGEVEYIPTGNSRILAGDILVILLPEKKSIELNDKLFKMGTGH